MTTRTPATEHPDSDILMTKLRELDKASFHKRGEAALRLAAMTVAAIRRLESRIEKLEGQSDAP